MSLVAAVSGQSMHTSSPFRKNLHVHMGKKSPSGSDAQTQFLELVPARHLYEPYLYLNEYCSGEGGNLAVPTCLAEVATAIPP